MYNNCYIFYVHYLTKMKQLVRIDKLTKRRLKMWFLPQCIKIIIDVYIKENYFKS